MFAVEMYGQTNIQTGCYCIVNSVTFCDNLHKFGLSFKNDALCRHQIKIKAKIILQKKF